MDRAELVGRYTRLVRRCPDATNAEVARWMGMRETSLERALSRARAAGVLDIRRRTVWTSDGPRVEVLPKES